MRLGFVTCVQLGLSCMEEIESLGGRLDLVITLHDDVHRAKSGRVFVDEFASRHGATLLKVRHVDDDEVPAAITRHELDWLFIIGWSQIAHRAVLNAPRCGVLGMHPTLLPVGRGRAPIPWAILLDLPATGVTLFQLDEGVDTGPILAQTVLPLAADETATTLYSRVAEAHRQLIRETLPLLESGRIEPVRQDESRATTWPARRPADGRIDPQMSVAEVDRLVRASTHPYPGAFWDSERGRVVIWEGTPHEVDRAGGLRLDLADGIYTALDYEPLESPP